jgi:CheY-like chemotaxis protein
MSDAAQMTTTLESPDAAQRHAGVWEPRVLVVDDEEVCRFAATTLLERLGLATDAAADGREALEMAAKRPYVAIFMDCSMPEVDGYTAAREIAHRDRHGRHTLVIAVTAHPRTVCIASGMDFHIAKPLEINELRADCALLGLLPPVGALPGEPAATLERDTPLLKLPGEGATGHDSVAAAELARTVIERATLWLPELWRATNAGDFPVLRLISREVGDPASVAGAVRVSALCRALAEAAAEGQTAVAAAIEPQIRRALADTTAAIESQVESVAFTAASNAPPSPIRVAIADDDPFARLAVETMIERADGLAFMGSADGVDGIVDLAVAERPDVVVLDWMMPGGGGPEAARQILRRTPDMTIVALTSSDSHDAYFEMTRAGARGFVRKGAHPDKLVQTIRRTLETAA